MRLAIMQPYLFPYIGYFQLIHAVDQFVFLDNVNYIKKGWINRNRILLSGNAHLFTLPIRQVSQNRLINEIQIVEEPKVKVKILSLFRNAYSGSSQFQSVYPLIEEIILFPESNLALFLENSVKRIVEFMGLEKKFLASSTYAIDPARKGKDRIVSLCRLLHADTYVNPSGGRALYDRDEFSASGINLEFLQPDGIRYAQTTEPFIPDLSIIDVLMFNSQQRLRQLLDSFRLT